ncbi:MAG TPA: hypothetical protein VD886_05470 [Herpetosiphonaceae bacterium]|nr:hypothetical protein [Herpetosiphonaceae bacterium]
MEQSKRRRRWGLDWAVWAPGAGRIEEHDEYLRLATADASGAAYSDAQLDDYAGTGLRWRPPMTMEFRARLGAAAGLPRGTAGFGLWNDPGGSRTRRLALPRALWFFYASPPSNLALDGLAPGAGWLAMTIDASRRPLLALLPLTPLALALMQHPWLRRALWPIGQWALGARQVALRINPGDWHAYRIEWQSRRARFWVDGALVLDTPFAPRGPLGLVLWIDNQYAVVTPRGALRGGLLAAPGEQWLDIAELEIG